jgi:hypothetical protein
MQHRRVVSKALLGAVQKTDRVGVEKQRFLPGYCITAPVLSVGNMARQRLVITSLMEFMFNIACLTACAISSLWSRNDWLSMACTCTVIC